MLFFLEDVLSQLSDYQNFIHLSRYARWREELGRRETWDETVDRYIAYFTKRTPQIPQETFQELKTAILNLEVLPSMRALMTAGKALEVDELGAYNCAFAALSDPRVFSEILYILMNGTGCGFSVERQYVNQLPTVAESFHDSETVLRVSDSKIGWAVALRELISLLYAGQIPKWDLSKVRPAGARLKTFGGRASGPEPLNDLMHQFIRIFRGAAGRKLTSLECHDLVCFIANAVIVGGVRRSALLSLSNLSDDRMRNAKSGQWWESNPQRALANNTAVYTDMPDSGTFMREWLSLYESKSGERGIFNHRAAEAQVRRTGRRKVDGIHFGTNPCVTADTWVMTLKGPRQVCELLHSGFDAVVEGFSYPASAFWSTGVKPVFELMTDLGLKIKATSNHRFLTDRGWIKVEDLTSDDVLHVNHHQELSWAGHGTFDEGWLVGEVVGNGYHTCTSGTAAAFWGEDSGRRKQHAVDILTSLGCHRKGCYSSTANKWTVQSKKLGELVSKYIAIDSKTILPSAEKASSDFICGFLRGYFDADGTVHADNIKGSSVRLSSVDLDKLETVQRMLLRLGIVSKIFKNRYLGGKRLLPDGYGGLAAYTCQTLHELCISRHAMTVFANRVGFYKEDKSAKLREVVENRIRKPYYSKFTTKITSITPLAPEEVFDCTVEGCHAFDGNGLLAHNCGEIVLRAEGGLCNLTEVIIRDTDTRETLKRKVHLASILGTMQSTLTNFRYLRTIWKKNAEEERLLGVSFTGIAGNTLMNGEQGTENLVNTLQYLKQEVINTNLEYAELLDIAPSVACTTVKPSGTASALADCSSGIHAWYSDYFIRRVRGDKKDPLSQLMYYSGVPAEDDYLHPEAMWVFSFPMKAPEGAVHQDARSAIEQLELYRIYKNNWCEHNVSITVTVKESEWMEVGAYVYKNFDDILGVSFLPESNHVYKQAPYTKCSKEDYEKAVSEMPAVNWNMLPEYETYDQTTGTQELACVAGGCEIR